MRSVTGAFGAALLASVLMPPAHAQSQSAAEDDQAGTKIEMVTVTARRRAEDLEKVPVAVTVLTGETLRAQEVKTATDLQTLAPSLTVAGNLGSRDTDVFTIRGQGQPFGGADPGVQSYFAEVPFNPSGPGSFYDMSSIQVLSGPQGTLFGRSTTGGAILFGPERPQNEFGGYIDGQLGNYDFRELQGALNVPVIDDTLLARGAFDIASRDGFTADTVSAAKPYTLDQDNLNYQSYRLGVIWRPISGFENYAVVDFFHSHTDGTGNKLTGLASQARLTAFAISEFEAAGDPNAVVDGTSEVALFYPFLQSALNNQNATGVRRTMSDIVPLFRRQSLQAVDIAQYDVTPEIQLRNIFGYLADKSQSGFDYDGSNLPILDIPNSRTWETNSLQVTDEIQVLGETPDKSINWIAGFYHELDHPAGYSEVEREVFGGGGVATPLSSTEVDSLGNGGTSNAIYGSATYNASSWADGLSLTAGGRFTWDHKVATALSCTCASYPPPGTPPCPSPLTSAYMQPTLTANFHAPTWTLAANYQITPDTMTYVTYRRGYKSGGFNSGISPTSGYAEFQPEYLTDVEVGTKNNWTILTVPGRTNFDAYYGWYDSIQKNDIIDVNGIPSALTLNAARATVKGIEFQSIFIPSEFLDVNAFYSYTDASYGTFSLPTEILAGAPVGIVNHAGNPFVYTPTNKLGLTANFHLPVDPALGHPTVSITWYEQSRVWFSDLSDLEPEGSQGSYGLINLRLDWNSVMGSSADISAFVNNATNAIYKVGGNPLEHLTGTDSSIYGPPRMWGFELRYRFGADAHNDEGP